jgi:branched-chain amino acid transport system substrate-binding protein
VRQGNQSGLFKMNKPFLFELGAAMEVLEALSDQMPTGLWAGTRWWYQEPKTDANRRFVESFFGKYGHFPSYNAQNAYTGLRLVAAAAEKARSLETDDLVGALEGFSMDSPMGGLTIRKEDHQAAIQAVWGKTAESRDVKFRALGLKFRVLDPVKVFKAEDITPAVSETGCAIA